jgi:V/A-type H+-transporting ATPase subunit A
MIVETKPVGAVVTRISGPIVTASGMRDAQMYEMVQVGDAGLAGEVVRLQGDRATYGSARDSSAISTTAFSARCRVSGRAAARGSGAAKKWMPSIRQSAGSFIRA